MSKPLTYPTSTKPFNQNVFLDPPSEYRGAPFWAWNHKQEEKATVAQVEKFDEMGMGGFHMHTRVGLDIPYMGEEYMRIVKSCVNKAKEKGMYAFLYDEDRWPSGFAGGKVLQGHPELRGLHLLFTPWPYGSDLPYQALKIEVANAYPVRSEKGFLLAKYDIELRDGLLVSVKQLEENEKGEHDIWYAYCEPNPDSGYMGDQTLPDLLSADMAKRFIETTHEVYKKHVGDHFGQTIPSMFTDEPQYCPIFGLNKANGKQEVFLPWTPKMEAEFHRSYGTNIIDNLPQVVWDTHGQQGNLTRYQFINLLSELFSNNYMGTISQWCEQNGIAATGHLNAEPTLTSQTAQMGEAMRAYRPMQFPGIDMLCDRTEYNTAKQAQSVSRQFGRRGVLCEMYGVTGWAFNFEGHKGQGDWQAALGVTLRVHHLAWSSMEGEAKRDYPACIGYQSPWYKEYKTIETHFARVNAAMTRGYPVTRVAVVHPIESFWLCAGPKDLNFEEMEYRDQAFADLTGWLLKSHLDFDFISESLFADQTPLDTINEKLPVGLCSYEVVVVPNLRTIRSTTLIRLEKFAAQGGKVIFAGSCPSMVDVKPVDSPPLIPGAARVSWSKAQILAQLHAFRDIDMVVRESTLYRTQGYRADSLFYQMRRDGVDRYLFVANTDRKQACPVDGSIKGEWKIEVLDTLNGNIWELQASQQYGKTTFSYYFDGCESALFRLTPGSSSAQALLQTNLRKDFKQVDDLVLHNITFSEPNVLLLDYCSHQWQDEPWQPAEEVLRIDQSLRARLGFFIKGAKFRQPWTIPKEGRVPAGTLKLKFAFESDIDLVDVKLAIERPDEVRIYVDDCLVQNTPDGWWVDEAIRVIPLPYLARGEHSITLEHQYGPLTNLERIYLLGVFGVSVHGRNARIVSVDNRRLTWGDLSRQGYPFYTGNVHYHCSMVINDAEPTALRVARYTGPTVSIDVDGKRTGLIIHEPYAIKLDDLDQGVHQVEVVMYGNRYNAFGELHLVPGKTNWIGADMWRTEFDWWTEEYVLEPIGILNAPRILKPGQEVSRLPQRRG